MSTIAEHVAQRLTKPQCYYCGEERRLIHDFLEPEVVDHRNKDGKIVRSEIIGYYNTTIMCGSCGRVKIQGKLMPVSAGPHSERVLRNHDLLPKK